MNRFLALLKSLVGLGGSSLQSPKADPNVPWKRLELRPGESEFREMPDASPVDAADEMIRRRLKEMGVGSDEPRMPIVDTDE